MTDYQLVVFASYALKELLLSFVYLQGRIEIGRLVKKNFEH